MDHYQIKLLEEPLAFAGRKDILLILDRIQKDDELAPVIQKAQSSGLSTIIFSQPAYTLTATEETQGASGPYLYEKKSPEELIALLSHEGYQLVIADDHASEEQALLDLNPRKPIALITAAGDNPIDPLFKISADVVIPRVKEKNDCSHNEKTLFEKSIDSFFLLIRKRLTESLATRATTKQKLLLKLFERIVRAQTDLSPALVLLLMIIESDDGTTGTQIAFDLGLDNTPEDEDQEEDFYAYGLDEEKMITPEFHEKLRAQLMPLIERNFINKQKNRYLITETGRHFLEKLWPIIEQVDYVISSGFSEEEIAALARSF